VVFILFFKVSTPDATDRPQAERSRRTVVLKKLLLMGIIPLASIAVFAVLEATAFIRPLEHRAYDLALVARPEPPAHPDLLLVPVDDQAIEYSGTVWPWPRDLMAKGLLLMKEFGAREVVLDILYEQASAPGINASQFAGVNETYDEAFSGLKEYFFGLEQSIASGALPLRELKPAAADFGVALDSTKKDLLDRLKEITYDRDEMLGNSARAFGNAFFAVNLSFDQASKPGDRLAGLDPALQTKFSVSRAVLKGKTTAQARDIVLPINPIMRGALGFGFPVIESRIDQADGVTRRVQLFYAVGDKLIPQLGFAAILDYLGNPAVDVSSTAVVLKGALPPGSGKQTDITVPLTEDGAMLINWNRKKPQESFKSISFKALLAYDRTEDDLVYNLKLLAAQETAGGFLLADGPAELLDRYYTPLATARTRMLEQGKSLDLKSWQTMRAQFITAVDKFLQPAKEEELVRSIRTKNAGDIQALTDLVHSVYRADRDLFRNYQDIRAQLSEKMKGAICFTSWTAAGTIDIGVTPFVGSYENVGTHLSAVNTILSGQFLDDVPAGVTIAITAVCTLLVFFIGFGIKRPLLSVLSGAGSLFVMAGGLVLFFALTGIYPGLLSPVLSAALVFVVFTVVNYLSTAKEKNFIRHAFARYVSKEMINELVADPSKLNLGGEEKQLTALFTDIKGFSGFSEKLNPPGLVRLLNGYFTDMANIILDLHGCLDKYVGDAIVSFFGAPIPLERHAHAACLAAVRMKHAEKVMNEHLIAEKLSPQPLLTRIGINTGEMLVGNMGSEDRLSYTVMGHNVNLAARLEGVNKQYGTWILISESSQKAAGAAFLTRRLDRVRVVGITKPVRLYELIDEKSRVRPELFEVIDIFHRGLELYENRDWDKAKAAFKAALKLRPHDATTELYVARCLMYKKKPPAPDWDGVVALTSK
jgi:adenylate cyclase